jgi:O-antigen/teichoic acid export membrane protein
MSLKKNIIANYISQISLALIGIVMMPMYIKYMGTEAYGLVGFYIMMQAWMQLLDMGMTPTLIRETARYRGGSISLLELRQLLRTLETVFFCFSLLGVLASFFFSSLIAKKWLNIEYLPIDTVRHSINLIGLAVILRWISSLYRGVVTGFEKLIWFSVYNIFISGVRFIAVLPVLLWINNDPQTFFAHQLLVSVVEVVLLKFKSRNLIRQQKIEEEQHPISIFDWNSLQKVLKFSTTVAFTASVWAVVTQSDKLILSKILTLGDYAYFTLATLASSGILLLSNTAGTALMPRFSKLGAEDKKKELIDLYRIATKYVGSVTIPATLVLIFFPEPLLFVWTGDVEIAAKAKNILSLYALGNGLLVFNAFPYYLQYASGNLRLHFIGSVLYLLFFFPVLMILSLQYGVVGAGWSWFAANFINFIVWVAYVHSKIYPKMHLKWLFNDIGISLYFSIPIILLINYFIIWPVSRIQTFYILTIVCIVLLSVSLSALFLLQLPKKK